MEVLVFNEQSDLSIALDSVEPIVKNVLKLEKRLTNEVSIHFVSTDVISSLHEEYFNDPSTTDCISFPMDEDTTPQEGSSYHILGEVFICPKTALDYTKDNPYEETTLYLVHALLHLMGYDDKEETDRKKMREAEKRHMKNLTLKNCLLGTEV